MLIDAGDTLIPRLLRTHMKQIKVAVYGLNALYSMRVVGLRDGSVRVGQALDLAVEAVNTHGCADNMLCAAVRGVLYHGVLDPETKERTEELLTSVIMTALIPDGRTVSSPADVWGKTVTSFVSNTPR
jgi:hypothetical protein